MNSDGNLTHDLAMVPLFARLPSETLAELARTSRVRRYPPGQVICNEGDPGNDLIVLEKGHLRISRFTADGTEAVLSVVRAPAALGELALLDGEPRDATVTAQGAVTVRLIPRAVVMDLVRREPAAVDGMLRSLAAMVRASNSRYADFVSLDVPGRLAKWLLRQAETGVDESVPAGTTVVLHGSQSDLAAELGTTRSTLNRALHEFESLGYIELQNGRVILRKPSILQSYTG